jgi:hypothetical protein
MTHEAETARLQAENDQLHARLHEAATTLQRLHAIVDELGAAIQRLQAALTELYEASRDARIIDTVRCNLEKTFSLLRWHTAVNNAERTLAGEPEEDKMTDTPHQPDAHQITYFNPGVEGTVNIRPETEGVAMTGVWRRASHMNEPPDGTTVTDQTGHAWTRRGDRWYCRDHNEAVIWDWQLILDDATGQLTVEDQT